MRNFILSLFFAFVPSTLASLGVDISVATSQESFACLLNQGYTFVVIRAYCSYGQVDPNLLTNIQNAFNAGFQNVELYIFPCFPCANPRNQVIQIMEAIVPSPYFDQIISTVWIDVTQYAWSANQQDNQKFLATMGNYIVALDGNWIVGVLTSQSDWTNIIGNNWKGSQNFVLWTIQHDDVPEINSPLYGGLLMMVMKQYEGPMTICNTTVNLDTDTGAPQIEY